jgi:metal-responsive CopG/Arc/MetJ family transcriptional regulator
MKTALSIPDALFQAADELAAKEKLSRSQLYARAMEQYLATRKKENMREEMREALRHIDQTPDPAWEEAQRLALLRSEWK